MRELSLERRVTEGAKDVATVAPVEAGQCGDVVGLVVGLWWLINNSITNNDRILGWIRNRHSSLANVAS